eukprot:3632938-Amphidinium_carterae.2
MRIREWARVNHRPCESSHSRQSPQKHWMLKVNDTTAFAEVHQWISNLFNSTYSGTVDELGTIRGVNNEDEQFNKWMKGKGQGQ